MVKTILYKRTIALGTSIHLWKYSRRSKPRGDSAGFGWRKEAVKTGGRIHNTLQSNRRARADTPSPKKCPHCIFSITPSKII